ncbi:hypothetical protein [Dendronalium sp. ChiSLP03b]|uniref:hypothetical protein n=1 Tax=Dendronalium sp. ChiSLP03b TaxID=3075381 RepID=UPI002ADAF920|nr:hypothetical protein [Dendronalium sp. ChiSLP03b]
MKLIKILQLKDCLSSKNYISIYLLTVHPRTDLNEDVLQTTLRRVLFLALHNSGMNWGKQGRQGRQGMQGENFRSC